MLKKVVLGVFSVVLVGALGLFGTVEASDFHSPRTAALGGAGHGAPLLTDAIYLNPAMGAFLPTYAISTGLNSFSGPDDAEPNGRVLHASILDGTNPNFQAGLGYTRVHYGREIHVSASTKVAAQYGAGIGGKFFFGSDSRQSAQDATLSSIGQPLPWLQTGVVIDNVLESGNAQKWNRYREFTLGLKANIEKLLFLYFDPHLAPNLPGSSYGYEAGIEVPIMTDLYLRGGVNRNSFQPHLATYGKGYGLGFGVAFPRLSLDFAYEKTQAPLESKGIIFSLTII